jgi:hypothetical protein
MSTERPAGLQVIPPRGSGRYHRPQMVHGFIRASGILVFFITCPAAGEVGWSVQNAYPAPLRDLLPIFIGNWMEALLANEPHRDRAPARTDAGLLDRPANFPFIATDGT